MKKIKKLFNSIKISFLIILISFLLMMFIDFFFGKRIMKKFDHLFAESEFYEKIIRINHPTFHHMLRADVNYKKYKSFEGLTVFCTDNHGFRNKCDTKTGKKFDLAFIGDSFVEAGSLNYEDTFVGMFNNYSKKRIANLGVTSYSPSIYLAKINFLLNNGYDFKHIIIFIDVGDLYDEAFKYTLNDKLEVIEKGRNKKRYIRKEFLRNNFPVLNFSFWVIRKSNLFNNKANSKKESDPISENFVYTQSLDIKTKWTYSTKNDMVEGYNGKISDHQKNLINTMTNLYEILNKKDIKMSVAVFPNPQQLLYDTRKSVYVLMWEDFCKNKCSNFINYFDDFFDLVETEGLQETIIKYYWKNDPHFNKEGNRVIFDKLKTIYK
tara:strand:+ start:61 stop:1197 length:1137 start_codon:yes stop_codon:yes gene_type:complete